MKFSLLPVAASIVVISSLGAAVATDHSAISRASSMSSTAPMAKDNLSLTTAQQKLAWRDLSKQAVSPAPSKFSAAEGTTVPSDITLRPIPSKVSNQIPRLKPYQYARLPNEVLIVNPTDKKVVDVINRRA